MWLTEGLGELQPDVLAFPPAECFSTFHNIFSSLLPPSTSGQGFKAMGQTLTPV